MNEAIRKVWEELQHDADEGDRRFAELLRLCEEHKVPRVTVFVHLGDGWYDMRGAYVLTNRTDAAEYIWHVSQRQGLGIFDADGNNRQELEVWDPEAVLVPYCSEGATMLNPIEWMRRRKRGGG